MQQLDLFTLATPARRPDATIPEFASYDKVVVSFSGGKDSIACLLHLLDQGVTNIELWHNSVDGDGQNLFDWRCTHAYVKAFAAAFGLPLYFSYKVGGFEREMLRNAAPTAPIYFETPDGSSQVGGTSTSLGTRLKFPQLSADLSVRWCSAYLKIDVAAAALRNQDRFLGKRTLFVTGERAQESPARAKYQTFEPHRTDNRDGSRRARHVDHWRPVHAWSEEDVWAIIERYRVQYHPAYALGFGRLSCAKCIFASPDQWASLWLIDRPGVQKLIDYERQFGITLRRGETLEQTIARGTPYPMLAADIAAAMSDSWDQPILMEPGTWRLPAGAFGEAAGPT